MKKNLVLMCMSIMMMFSGCAVIEAAKVINEDPMAEVIAASLLYQSTVKALVIMRDEGLFDEDEIHQITEILVYADKLIVEWYEAVKNEEDDPEYAAAFKVAISWLQEYLKPSFKEFEERTHEKTDGGIV